MIAPKKKRLGSLRTVGLFAGIGGIELGLHRAGHETVMFCEIDESAQRVLRDRFPGVPVRNDVCAIPTLPPCDVLTAGFPCQDLSQAGRTAGIGGARSGLVDHVFRLLESAKRPPKWVLLENVSFMLRLDNGRAMTHVTTELQRLGYAWAYRVIDTRAFGIPQRRQRVLILASKSEDPRGPLLGQDAGEPAPRERTPGVACGFYWTEGSKGLGWAVDAVPTLKGGSTIGIASPPAIWTHDDQIVTPDIRDAERLQGFPADWTLAAVRSEGVRANAPRWKLVGNAVTVNLSEWLGRRLATAARYDSSKDLPLNWSEKWPGAAWSIGGATGVADVSMWPVDEPGVGLRRFLEYDAKPLSHRAASGFLRRAEKSSLRFPVGLLDAIRAHVERSPAKVDSA